MLINTNSIVSTSEANQNFSRVTRIADAHGPAVIFKNNKPKYLLVDIDSTPYKDFAFRRHNLTCNAGRFVHIQTLVQNGIGDEIAQFVRMSSSDAFGSLVFCHISFLSERAAGAPSHHLPDSGRRNPQCSFL